MQVLEAYLVRDSRNSDPTLGVGWRDAPERSLLYLCSLLSAEITIRPDGNGTVLLEGTVRDIPVGQPIDAAGVCFDCDAIIFEYDKSCPKCGSWSHQGDVTEGD